MTEFTIDQDKINEIVRRGHHVLGQESARLRKYMPQHNLPPEFEYSPKQRGVKEPELAAEFLLTEAFFERRTQSRQIINACLEVWENPQERWVFNPAEVAKAFVSKIDEVMQKLPYTAHKRNSWEVSEHYQQNALIIKNKFDNDPRNLIHNLKAEDARKNLDRLWGIGNGIANLYIVYLIERQIASPQDPRNALLKVDVHKARIPLNVEAVVMQEREIRRSELEKSLEQAYWLACDALKLPPEIVDGALWVIGSEICARKDYYFCGMNCPLVDMCKAYTPKDRKTSKFRIYDAQGRRVDVRKNLGQANLFPRQF